MRAAIIGLLAFAVSRCGGRKEHTLSILPPAQLDELLNVVNLLWHFVGFWVGSIC